jgi:hypothetical protein
MLKGLESLAAGQAVGAVLIEAAKAASTTFLPYPSILAFADGRGIEVVWPLALLPALSWVAGGIACGAMTCGMSGSRAAGLLGGALLGLAPALIVNLAAPGQADALIAGCLPLLGALLGTRWAWRLRKLDASAPVG